MKQLIIILAVAAVAGLQTECRALVNDASAPLSRPARCENMTYQDVYLSPSLSGYLAAQQKLTDKLLLKSVTSEDIAEAGSEANVVCNEVARLWYSDNVLLKFASDLRVVYQVQHTTVELAAVDDSSMDREVKSNLEVISHLLQKIESVLKHHTYGVCP